MPSNYYIGETSSKRSNNGSEIDHSKMEGRKWEELNMDCLVNVFQRVGMESLLLDVPFVCKSWAIITLQTVLTEIVVGDAAIRDRGRPLYPDGLCWSFECIVEAVRMFYALKRRLNFLEAVRI
uniref:Uncharacterized protein n=1 Tax=Vitis vinifera TaxID=29760 RepID=A5BCV4_VITVI|nr:hypothetical protein VITISV_012622 [Vitis vinifera]